MTKHDRKLRNERVLKISIFKNVWNKINKNPPSNALQKISIYISILLSGVAAFLAYITLHQTQKVEGIEDVLQSFKSEARFRPDSMKATKNMLEVYGFVVNFGSRAALNITMETYFIAPNFLDYQKDVQTEGSDLAANEKFKCQTNVEGDFSKMVDFSQCVLCTKVRFVDAVTSKLDSTYTFATTSTINNTTMLFRISTRDEIKDSKNRINKIRPF